MIQSRHSYENTYAVNKKIDGVNIAVNYDTRHKINMKDKKTKPAFIEYLNDPKNKDLRFWQAIRNFSRYDFVFGWESDEFDFSKLPKGCKDTFYIESDSSTTRGIDI